MRWLKIALMVATGLFGWLGRTLFEGWTERSLASEAAEREEAQARGDAEAEAQAQAASRHEEHALLVEIQIEGTRALREEMVRQGRRREEIWALSRSHDVEVRSSKWHHDKKPEPEPEISAPMPASA